MQHVSNGVLSPAKLSGPTAPSERKVTHVTNVFFSDDISPTFSEATFPLQRRLHEKVLAICVLFCVALLTSQNMMKRIYFEEV